MTAQAQMPTPHMIGPMPRQMAQLNGGKPKIAQMTRSGSGRKQVISWMDAPDDLYFKATENNKWVIISKITFKSYYLSIKRMLYK